MGKWHKILLVQIPQSNKTSTGDDLNFDYEALSKIC